MTWHRCTVLAPPTSLEGGGLLAPPTLLEGGGLLAPPTLLEGGGLLAPPTLLEGGGLPPLVERRCLAPVCCIRALSSILRRTLRSVSLAVSSSLCIVRLLGPVSMILEGGSSAGGPSVGGGRGLMSVQ